MANARLGYKNHLDDMTASATTAALPASNVQLTRREKVWRSTVITSTDLKFTVTDSTARPFSCLALWHNAHGASVRAQIYSDTAWTTGVYDSGTVALSPGLAVTSPFGYKSGDSRNNDLLYFSRPWRRYFAPVNGKSVKFTFTGTPTDVTGTLAYFQVVRAWGGPYFEFERNPAVQPALEWVFDGGASRTAGGSLVTSAGFQFQKLECNFAYMTDNDRAALWQMAGSLGAWNDGIFSLFPGANSIEEYDHFINGRFAVFGPQIWDLAYKGQRLVIQGN